MSPGDTDSLRGTPWARTVSVYFAVVAALVATGIVVWALPRGFDLTDEGFYLLNYQPAQTGWGLSRFGPLITGLFFGHAPGVLTLRILHLVAALAGAVYLGLGVTRWARRHDLPWIVSDPWVTVPTVVLLSIAAFIFGPPTLSYNHLSELGAQLLLGSALRMDRDGRAWGPVVVHGLAAALLLLVKFTSLPFLVALGLVAAWDGDVRAWAAQVAKAAGVAVLALALYGLVIESPARVWQSARLDFELQSDGIHSESRLISKYRASLVDLWHFLTSSFPLLVGAGVLGAATSAAVTRFTRALVLLSSVVWLTLVIRALASDAIFSNVRQATLGYAFLLAAVAMWKAGEWGVAKARTSAGSWPQGDLRAVMRVGLVLLLAPFAATVGTNNKLMLGAVFHLAAWGPLLLLGLSRGRQASRGVVAGVAVVLVSALVVAHLWVIYVLHPYRLPQALTEQTMPAPEGSRVASLLLDERTHALVVEAEALKDQLGAHDKILGMYGLGGLVWMLDATSPGQPWIRPWGDGGEQSCGRILAESPESLAGVPILVDGRAPLPCLADAGSSFPEGYKLIGSLRRPLDGATIEVFVPDPDAS